MDIEKLNKAQKIQDQIKTISSVLNTIKNNKYIKLRERWEIARLLKALWLDNFRDYSCNPAESEITGKVVENIKQQLYFNLEKLNKELEEL